MKRSLSTKYIIGIMLLFHSADFERVSLCATPPEWFKNTIGYEIFVRSFADSDNDGIGDLRGIEHHLDDLADPGNELAGALGIDTIWLTPVFETPSQHGYDVTDYRKIDPDIGTESDFTSLVKTCHRKGVHIILDFPINGTSDRHPWFVESARGPRSPYRRWYLWRASRPLRWKRPWESSGSSEDVWHRKGTEFYYGLFGSHIPDLNLSNDAVTEEILSIARYWLNRGVDGFRLDAARYLVETGGGNGQADTLMTLHWMRRFQSALKADFPDIVFICEVWAPSPVIALYTGKDGPCDSAFDFPLAGSILTAVEQHAPFYIKNILDEKKYFSIGASRASIFLSNHDQTRVATRLPSLRQQKIAASLLLTLPGTPFIYYGEEIGMKGDKPDPNIRRRYPWNRRDCLEVVREPFCEQKKNPKSLWNHYRQLVHARKKLKSLRSSEITWIETSASDDIIAYLRGVEPRQSLVIINMCDVVVTPALSLPFTSGYRMVDILHDATLLTLKSAFRKGRIYFPALSPGDIQIWTIIPSSGCTPGK